MWACRLCADPGAGYFSEHHDPDRQVTRVEELSVTVTAA